MNQIKIYAITSRELENIPLNELLDIPAEPILGLYHLTIPNTNPLLIEVPEFKKFPDSWKVDFEDIQTIAKNKDIYILSYSSDWIKQSVFTLDPSKNEIEYIQLAKQKNGKIIMFPYSFEEYKTRVEDLDKSLLEWL